MLPLSGQIYGAYSYTSHAAGEPNACRQDGKRLWRICSMPYSEGRPGTAAWRCSSCSDSLDMLQVGDASAVNKTAARGLLAAFKWCNDRAAL